MYRLEYAYLAFLLPLPLLIWWLLPPYREETASVRIPFFRDIVRAAELTPSPGAVVPKSNWLQKAAAGLGWVLLILALTRPQFVEPPIEKIQPARDLLLALDLSQSMDTPDFHDPAGRRETRAAAVRAVVEDFVRRRATDRIGLIVFGDAPYPQAPFTLDHATVLAMLADMEPGMAGPRTALGDAIGLAIKMFAASTAPEKVLILLTDGNDTASRMPPGRAAEIARDNHILVHTVAIGDPAASGEDKVDVESLKRVAATTGGRYFFGQDQSQLEAVYTALDALTPANHKTLSWRPKRELFFYPLGAAILLLGAAELLMYLQSLLRQLRTPGAEVLS